MHLILIHFPTTAGSAQFCLLCCQPEPIPGTLAARKPLLTPRVPCRLPVWSRMNHLHELQDIVSSPTLHRQVLTAQESGFPTKYGATFARFFFRSYGTFIVSTFKQGAHRTRHLWSDGGCRVFDSGSLRFNSRRPIGSAMRLRIACSCATQSPRRTLKSNRL